MVFIFQTGSLGDTVIAMPCYREIARRHPGAERYLLTNGPIGKKMVPAESVLKPCGLIDGGVEYPMPLRGLRNIVGLYRRLRALQIDVLYYLSPEKSVVNLARHYVFFKLCGVRQVRGVPWSRDQRFPRSVVPGKLWESEASRLLRTIGVQSVAAPPKPSDRTVDLSKEEKNAALRLLAEAEGFERFIVVSVGGKVPINDWGNQNWKTVLASVSVANPELGAVFVGSADERERNERLAESWVGPKLNSCGRMTPRETAALIERAELFVGHDSGPLHLAAAVGTRIIGVYSARNVPGRWFSDRAGDRFFYCQTACFGCQLGMVGDCPNGVVCMSSHRQDEIVAAVQQALSQSARLVR